MILGGRDAGASAAAGSPDGAADATAEAAADLRSIAVLPFETRSEERQDEYFSERMHDDLLTQLSKIDSLTVISRTSVMQYASTTKTIREIAGELGVATVLEGAVQRAGDRVRVNVQLIEAASDRHLWAETYDEELTAANIFAIQSDLAREIAGALRATLTPDVAQRMAAVPTESMEAYELYTRARYVYETRGTSGQDLDEIRSLFERAIAADSSFAPAWAGLANVFLGAWNWRTMSPEEAGPRARMAVERALALDPTSADSYVAEARLLQFEGRDEEAERAVRQALELNPGSADAHARYGAVLERAGRYEEAVQQSRRAVELDPLSINGRSLLSDRLFYARRFDESIAEPRKVLEMQPDDWYSWYNMGWAYSVSGRPAQAVEAFREARSLASDRESVGLGLAYAFAKAGERDSTMAYLEGADPTSYDASLARFELGDTDEAFASLEIALEADPSQLSRLALDPSGDGLRADPRYEALARRFGSK